MTTLRMVKDNNRNYAVHSSPAKRVSSLPPIEKIPVHIRYRKFPDSAKFRCYTQLLGSFGHEDKSFCPFFPQKNLWSLATSSGFPALDHVALSSRWSSGRITALKRLTALHLFAQMPTALLLSATLYDIFFASENHPFLEQSKGSIPEH